MKGIAELVSAALFLTMATGFIGYRCLQIDACKRVGLPEGFGHSEQDMSRH